MWRRLLDYEEVLAGDLGRREAAGAGVPVILNWSGSVTIDGDTFGAGFVAGPAARYADTVSRGHARGVQVDLDLVAARHLLGRPAHRRRRRLSPYSTRPSSSPERRRRRGDRAHQVQRKIEHR